MKVTISILSVLILFVLGLSIYNFNSINFFNYQFKALKKNEFNNFEFNKELAYHRYKEIYNALCSLNNMPTINYDFLDRKNGKSNYDFKKLKGVTQTITERYSKIIKQYNKVKPLLSKSIIDEIEIAIKRERDLSRQLSHALYTGQDITKATPVSSLLNIKLEIEDKINNALVKQIRSLLKE